MTVNRRSFPHDRPKYAVSGRPTGAPIEIVAGREIRACV
jgi:hypothetical protein